MRLARLPVAIAALLVSVIFPGHSMSAADELSVQEALLRTKPAVALVVAEVSANVIVNCGAAGEQRVTPGPFRETGTGWFVSSDGWMITNAHVVSPAHQPPKWLIREQVQKAVREGCVPKLLARRGLQPGQRPDLEAELTQQALATAAPGAKVTLEPTLFVILSNGIRLPATVAKYSPPVAGEAMSGRDLALLRLEAADMPMLRLADSSDTKIGDRLHILGFPGVVLSHELLNASAKVEASVTNGAISGFKQDVTNQPVIQTDAPAAWGNSGGPAVNSQGDVIGVLTFVSLAAGDQGAIVQGFNFVIPSAAVTEFLKDTPAAKAEPSRFNAAWHAALREFFAGGHARAERHFAEANRLLPDLPDVRRLAAENQERIKNPPPRPFPWALVATGVMVMSLGAYGALVGVRWRRNRYRIRPAEVQRMVESGNGVPIILDVRDAPTYAKSPVRIPRAVHVPAEQLETGIVDLEIEPERTVVAYCT